jgi:metal-responsive CopG/Arc/MetJ family transcriptional regulator|tara:strand:- start:283 stop:447 length:165 start_codon:yes stop_codon:yes gene_type:complete
MNSNTAPDTTKISLELPTPLLTKTREIAQENMCSLSAIVRQSMRQLVETNSNKL